MITVASPEPRTDTATADRALFDRLVANAADDAQAVALLRDIVVRAARHQVRRMPRVWAELGAVRAEEIVESAADQATVDVIAHLDRFEGRSRFRTWVFKFGIWHAAAEARRSLWRDRPVLLDEYLDPPSTDPVSPAAQVEHHDLVAAVGAAIDEVLTPHQRRVARALIVDEVPIDVLAQALGTNRNALYKTLHDARVKLRSHLHDRGFLPAPEKRGGR
ncbi:MAG: sigma-70 family RNA polymerase sigma factor [Microthrixaceae bacterium]